MVPAKPWSAAKCSAIACRFTANPSGDNRRGRDLEDEAHDAKERTKSWFGSKKDQAEDAAEDAKVRSRCVSSDREQSRALALMIGIPLLSSD